VKAVAGEIRTLPESPDAVRKRISDDLAGLLGDAYARAFLPPIVVSTSPRPKTPAPTARPPLGDLFTDEARATLPPDTFAPGENVSVTRGTVRFTGVATVEGDAPGSALVSVDFEAAGLLRPAPGDPLGMRRRPVRLKQTGQLLCLRTEAGWRIAGYDVRLTVERQVVPPSETPK
jgi:hypothetical protein